eukprot:m.57433 g.57433  ORF g.57433 m.57433 type:complete len:83 (-) comp11108_c0_seq1:295-543(-)
MGGFLSIASNFPVKTQHSDSKFSSSINSEASDAVNVLRVRNHVDLSRLDFDPLDSTKKPTPAAAAPNKCKYILHQLQGLIFY